MSLPVDLKMHPINTWRDVTQFAGCIVAFKTNSAYISANSYRYVLNNDRSIEFGYVEPEVVFWSNGKLGHGLYRLIDIKEAAIPCALTDLQINATTRYGSHPINISMRKVSLEEINSIAKAVLADQAFFEYKDVKRKAIHFLSEYTGMLITKSLQE